MNRLFMILNGTSNNNK